MGGDFIGLGAGGASRPRRLRQPVRTARSSVAVMGSEASVFAPGVRLSPGAQELRAATAAGLVTLDAQGEIEPGAGRPLDRHRRRPSYIFRLREGTWPDGAELTGESARGRLAPARSDNCAAPRSGLDLAPVGEVRAMAGRVVEIDLASPMPDFLRLLAQPELALTHRGLSRSDGDEARCGRKAATVAELTFQPPEVRGLPQDRDWREHVRAVEFHALERQDRARRRSTKGEVDVVLGGTLGAWPLADPGPLSRGNLRLDNALGLFGLQVMRESGFLAATARTARRWRWRSTGRAAVAPFNIGGWVPTTRIVPRAARRSGNVARTLGRQAHRPAPRGGCRRVAAWRDGAGKGQAPALTIALGREPGLRHAVQRARRANSARSGITSSGSAQAPADLVAGRPGRALCRAALVPQPVQLLAAPAGCASRGRRAGPRLRWPARRASAAAPRPSRGAADRRRTSISRSARRCAGRWCAATSTASPPTRGPCIPCPTWRRSPDKRDGQHRPLAQRPGRCEGPCRSAPTRRDPPAHRGDRAAFSSTASGSPARATSSGSTRSSG